MKSYTLHALVVLILLAVAPIHSSANVIINEIAWMGTNISPNDEWIELYNSGGTSVDLTGWKVESVDGSPSIMLSGSIDPQSFFLLERTDDSTVPGVVASLVYTGSLANTGETLKLINESQVTVDTVSGGNNWENVGGSSDTLSTAQRYQGIWITASPTPGETNASVDEGAGDVEETEESNEELESVPASTALKRSAKLEARIDVDKKYAAVGSVVTMRCEVPEDFPRGYSCLWNMGDGAVLKGDEVVHSYKFPGRYIIAASIVAHKDTVRKQVTIDIVEPTVSITEIGSGNNGYVTLMNEGSRIIDLSQWSLRSGRDTFLIPYDTYLAPGQSIVLSSDTTGLEIGSTADILLPSGVVYSQFPHKNVAEPVYVDEEIEYVAPQHEEAVIYTENASDDMNKRAGEVFGTSTGAFIAGSNQEAGTTNEYIWWGTLIGLLGVGSGATVMFSRNRKEETFEILEEK